MESPSFTFRLERVRSLRERTEDAAREELARELAHRLRGEALVRQATSAATAARDSGRDTVLEPGASGADLLAAQAWMERVERRRLDALADHDAEALRRAQIVLDEGALTAHRRGSLT